MAFALFGVNFVWEMAQAGYCSSKNGLPSWSGTWLYSRAAIAAVAMLIPVIALFVFVALFAATNRRSC